MRESVEEKISADLVVLAVGGRPDEALFEAINSACGTAEVYNIGDSFHGGKVFEATKSGYALALSL